MTIQRTAMWVSMSLVTLGAVGCDVLLSEHSRRDPVYVEQRPAYVEEQPQYVVVQEAPPPIRVERRPAPPSVDVIWIDGSWNWDSRQYVWVSGRYERPPQPDVIWISASYDSGAHRYTPGRWSKPSGGNGRGNDNGRGRGRGN